MRYLLILFLFVLCFLIRPSFVFAATCNIASDGSKGANVALNSAGANENVAVALKIPSSLMAKLNPDDPKRKNINTTCTADMAQSVYICAFCGKTDSGGNANINIPSNYFPVDGTYVYAVGKKDVLSCALSVVGTYIYCGNTGITMGNGQIARNINLLQPESCPENGGGIKTAIGCFPTSPPEIVKWLLGVGAVVGGALSFLQMLWGAFQTIMSAGDPEKLKAGQETIVAAIEGILVIIFAVFILRLIGFTILKIPDFG